MFILILALETITKKRKGSFRLRRDEKLDASRSKRPADFAIFLRNGLRTFDRR